MIPPDNNENPNPILSTALGMIESVAPGALDALERQPVDICRQRREGKIVLGNVGVVRIVRCGPAVTRVEEGDICMLVAIGTKDCTTTEV